jgi:hypothetical protein
VILDIGARLRCRLLALSMLHGTELFEYTV